MLIKMILLTANLDVIGTCDDEESVEACLGNQHVVERMASHFSEKRKIILQSLMSFIDLVRRSIR